MSIIAAWSFSQAFSNFFLAVCLSSIVALIVSTTFVGTFEKNYVGAKFNWDFKKNFPEIMPNYSESRKPQSLISRSIFYCSFKVKNICIVVNRINEFAYTSSIWIPSTLTISCLQVFLNIQINDKSDWISTVMYVGIILKNSSEPNHFH